MNHGHLSVSVLWGGDVPAGWFQRESKRTPWRSSHPPASPVSGRPNQADGGQERHAPHARQGLEVAGDAVDFHGPKVFPGVSIRTRTRGWKPLLAAPFIRKPEKKRGFPGQLQGISCPEPELRLVFFPKAPSLKATFWMPTPAPWLPCNQLVSHGHLRVALSLSYSRGPPEGVLNVNP